jgi:hypothetical protein
VSTFSVDVIRISEIKQHDNADALELAMIEGSLYQVVIPKDQYHPGDIAIHVPVDTIVPPDAAELWGVTKYLSNGRVRAARLRGQVSYGFLAPADGRVLGTNVADEFRLTHYEPPIKVTVGDCDKEVSTFFKYTDIENLMRYSRLFEPGEEVIVTEKTHGCLASKTFVVMDDGTRKRIRDIVVGDSVLGVDSNGGVISADVEHVFNNGLSDGWLKVTGDRYSAGRGSSFFSVECTSNHRFFRPMVGKYVDASELTPGMEVLLIRSEMGLTPLQEQILIGMALGDGSAYTVKNSAALHWSHKEDDVEYLDWIDRGLGNLSSGVRDARVSGYGTDMILAFWSMDDGSLTHSDDQEDRVSLAICGFDTKSCHLLVDVLKRFDVDAVLHHTNGYPRLRLNARDAEKFFLLVAPYIPPAMQRKLPVRYRGHDGWLPQQEQEYQPLLVAQTIRSVEPLQGRKLRYDIQTSTGNFFANGVLVHNSNSRVGYIKVDDELQLVCGSRPNRRRLGYGSVYEMPLGMKSVTDLLYQHPESILFGEIYGPKVQGAAFGYGVLGADGYKAFDLMVNGSYVDYDVFEGCCCDHGVPIMPVLYRGPFDLELLRSMANGKSTFDPDTIREGIVVRPIKERMDGHIGRVILKLHGDDFLLSKGG